MKPAAKLPLSAAAGLGETVAHALLIAKTATRILVMVALQKISEMKRLIMTKMFTSR